MKQITNKEYEEFQKYKEDNCTEDCLHLMVCG